MSDQPVVRNEDEEILSAQVVIKRDAASQAGALMQAFRDVGFEVGSIVANNFSITAPKSAFERHAGDVSKLEKSGLDAARASSVMSDLDAARRALVETIVFPKPPDFGPVGQF